MKISSPGLYPFQDEVLNIINRVETGFYLTGGTAALRGCLDHCCSDDPDLFVNDDPDFTLWTGRIIQALNTSGPSAEHREKQRASFPWTWPGLLLSASKADYGLIRWVSPPPAANDFVHDLHQPGEKLLLAD